MCFVKLTTGWPIVPLVICWTMQRIVCVGALGAANYKPTVSEKLFYIQDSYRYAICGFGILNSMNIGNSLHSTILLGIFFAKTGTWI